ncbi:MAG: hypothetical protein ACLU0O_08720 [Collinsella sp.]
MFRFAVIASNPWALSDRAAEYAAHADEVRDLGSRPSWQALSACCAFFTGWVLRRIGADLIDATSAMMFFTAMSNWKEERPRPYMALGMNLPETLMGDDLVDMLDEVLIHACRRLYAGGDLRAQLRRICALWFYARGLLCQMICTLCAIIYLFRVRDAYGDYMTMLNSRGVAAIKEMCFDDYYGFADEM